LFSGCIEFLGGCPPVYQASVRQIPPSETVEVYTNITSSNLSQVPRLVSLMDKVTENVSLTYESVELDPSEWNSTIEFLDTLKLSQAEWQYQYQWFLFYKDEFIEIEFYVIVC
jgi:hypothetical protein